MSTKSLTTSEIVSKTVRLSPFENFKRRTLGAISGLWQRLLYLVELRSADGKYDHWGHNQVYGEVNSQAALARAHSEVYLEVLRTPLRSLTNEAECGDDRACQQYPEFSKLMVPTDVQGGSPRHLSSVVLAVRLLRTEAQQVSTRSSA